MQCVRFFLKIGNKLFSRGRVKITPAAVRMRVVFAKTSFQRPELWALSMDVRAYLWISKDVYNHPWISKAKLERRRGCYWEPTLRWHLGTIMVQNSVPGKERVQRGVHFTIGCWPRIV